MSATGTHRLWTELRYLFVSKRPLATFGFFVLGMHRSGTSCLTGLLETAGVWLSKDVSRRNRANPRGTLEDKQVQRVNSKILRQFGGDWDRPPRSIDCDQVDPRPLYRALAPYRKHARWALKDPRLVLTLEAWLPLVYRHQLIGGFRHPMAVARSLQARNGMPACQALALWTHYNNRLVELHQRHHFPLVSFDITGAEYLTQFAALCGLLGLDFNARAARRFYDEGSNSQSRRASEPVPGPAAEAYEYLLRHQLSRAPASSQLRQADCA